MICTANGVIAHLEEYGDCRMTDLYFPDGSNGLFVLLRTTAGGFSSDIPHLIVNRIHHWFDEHRDYGVLLALAEDVTITDAGAAFIQGRQ